MLANPTQGIRHEEDGQVERPELDKDKQKALREFMEGDVAQAMGKSPAAAFLAVDIVRAYLTAGGERAPAPPPGYYPVIPHQCPICGAAVTFDPKLSSEQRGAGWRCEVGGSAHYWQRMGQASALKFARKRAIQQGLPVPEPLPAESW